MSFEISYPCRGRASTSDRIKSSALTLLPLEFGHHYSHIWRIHIIAITRRQSQLSSDEPRPRPFRLRAKAARHTRKPREPRSEELGVDVGRHHPTIGLSNYPDGMPHSREGGWW